MNTEILIIIGVIIFFIITWIKFAKHRFDYKEGEPNIRYCHACGQCQVKVTDGAAYNEEPEVTYWKDFMVVKDKNCHCHDYVGV